MYLTQIPQMFLPFSPSTRTPREKQWVYLMEFLCDLALYQLWGTEQELTFLQEVKEFGHTYNLSFEIYRWTQQRPPQPSLRLRDAENWAKSFPK